MGGGWAIFFVERRAPGRRVRGRGGTLSGLRALLMFAAAWLVLNRALILCQTLCRLRGRCTRPARALPFGTPWGGARGLVGGHGRLPSPESDWCAFGCVESSLNEAPWPLLVRSVPTTRYKESSWVFWSGCIVNLFWAISQSLPSRLLNANTTQRQCSRVTASESCISYIHSSAVQSDCIKCLTETLAVSTQWPHNSQICRVRFYWSRASPRATP